jgi:DNA/RNA-binding domain of Phe-tRNA-synthetase-like protein
VTEPEGPTPIVAAIDTDLAGVVRLGLVRAEPIVVGPSGPALDAEIAETVRSLVERHADQAPASIPGLAPARDLYRAFGIDPTRTRPSSEALLRRAVQGKPLPRILNAVDLCNLCALRFLLPIGLYDAARLSGPVTLRRGREAESYAGIRKDEVHLAGRPVLADVEGPFGNPTSDSLRTAVIPATRSLWMVIFAPADYPADSMRSHVERACSDMARYLGGAGVVPETNGALCPAAGHGWTPTA